MLKEIKVKSSGSFGVSNGMLAINPDHIVAATSSDKTSLTIPKGSINSVNRKVFTEDLVEDVMDINTGDVTLHMITKDKIVIEADQFRILLRSIAFDRYDPRY